MEALYRHFSEQFGRKPDLLFSAPGRTELGGNHTDHQHGLVLAAAVDLDTRAAVAPNGDACIRLWSEGYGLCTVTLPAGPPRLEEGGTTAALIRGVAARFAELGLPVTGFDACVTSTVLPGSGLSSSAAFEVLLGVILDHLGGCKMSPARLAEIGQWAENVYFGKPCGLMDQMASAVGGVVGIDFADPARPEITPLSLDLNALGYALCIIDTGANHAGLTAAYAAIPAELGRVCRCLGKEVLRQVDETEFFAQLPALRQRCGDRAVLRAIHVFDENRRVAAQIAALQADDFDTFLRLVTASGLSSWRYLQNVVPEGCAEVQALALALALCERALQGRGACRVHGGGFAGTVQAFVPLDLLDRFRAQIEAVFGSGCCHVLSIRPTGGGIIRMEESL